MGIHIGINSRILEVFEPELFSNLFLLFVFMRCVTSLNDLGKMSPSAGLKQRYLDDASVLFVIILPVC